MGTFMLAAVTDSAAPYAIAMAVGFAIGVYGHIIKSRPVILTGILIVGALSAYFAFAVAKIT